jgi:hypothetical protein
MPSHSTTSGLTTKQPAEKASMRGLLFSGRRGKIFVGIVLLLFYENISILLLRRIFDCRL